MGHDLKDIRRMYSVQELLGVSGRKKTLVCPLPQHIHVHNTASFSIFAGHDGADRWKCHGNCGLRGDIIDLAGYMWIPGYDPSDGNKVLQAAGVLGARGNLSIPTPETIDRAPVLHPMRWQRHLPIGEEARAYCRKRGLSDRTIEDFRLGQDGYYLTMPSFVSNRLMGIKKRAVNSKAQLRYTSEEGSKQSLFNYDSIAYKSGLVVLTKGEIPVMILDQLGYLACAPTGGEGAWLSEWDTILALADVLVVGDNDDVGRKYFSARAADLNGTLKFPPAQFKDLDEWILAEPKESRLTLERWINAI